MHVKVCIGLLWRINNKRGKHSLKQLHKYRKLYIICLQIRETDISFIPESLQV